MDVPQESVDPRDELIRRQAERIQQLEEELRRLKELLERKASAKAAKTPNFSLDRNPLGKKTKDKTKKSKSKKKRGRKPKQAKLQRSTEQHEIYPSGADPKACILRRTQFAWRIVDGKAIYVAYHIYDLPDAKELPLPAGLRNSRSEFGIEIILILAFLYYWIGVSLDNACQIMNFFTGLSLAKSQAESLLKQLARDWDQQYDTIAELIALQMIVYIDETGWKVGKKSCYTWVFSTTMHVLYRCGVSRKKDEANAVLGDNFGGIGVTDDYAAYKSMFSQHQLCWAHLIRKAIKLALQHPDQPEYASFLDQLCAIYNDAKELSAQRDEGAIEATIEKLQDRIKELCTRHEETIVKAKDAEPGTTATAKDVETFILLQRELINNLDCLFVFVEHPEVEPTNNRSERNVRREAEIRKGARTSKTASGAKRRGTIITVLASLHTRIANFTLSNLLLEITSWFEKGCSIFEQELKNIRPNPPTQESAIC